MPCVVEVLFTPAEFRALREHDISKSTCVVFDVLRATSTFVTALVHGAQAIIPVGEISEALDIRHRRPEVLLAGERNGLRITSAWTGGVDFDLGNSPREYTPEKVRGRTIVSTTTNGTRALQACAGARLVCIAGFLNLAAVTEVLLNKLPPHLLLVCAGTGETAALEDMLAAGALCERLAAACADLAMLDSALMVRRLFVAERQDLAASICTSQNARRLLAHPELREDVEWCLRVDRFKLVSILDEFGVVVKAGQ